SVTTARAPHAKNRLLVRPRLPSCPHPHPAPSEYLLTAVFARPPTVESPLAFIPTALSRSPRIELSRTIHIRGETRGLVQHVVSAGAPAFLPSSCSRARAPTETTLFVGRTKVRRRGANDRIANRLDACGIGCYWSVWSRCGWKHPG